MPNMQTAQEWLGQSNQLLQTRPNTTRITTKYTLKAPKEIASTRENAATSTQPPAARARLTLKTYDSATGVTLKYKTDKAAEVGRLITILSMLGRGMAGLPKVVEDIDMLSAPVDSLETGGAQPGDGQSGPGVGQGGTMKKSKKKGKR